MKPYLNFSQTKSNYSLQHNFTLIFRKIELVFFCFLCVIFLITSKLNKDFTDNVSMGFVSVSLPVVKFAAFPFNATINLLTNFSDLVDAKKENIALKEEIDKLRVWSGFEARRSGKMIKPLRRGAVMAAGGHFLFWEFFLNQGPFRGAGGQCDVKKCGLCFRYVRDRMGKSGRNDDVIQRA